MPRRRAPEPIQDPLDLGIEFPAVPGSTRKDITKGYLVQVKVQNPAMCGVCIQEMRDGTRKQANPNRVTHRAWLPKMNAPILMCSEHAVDFGTTHSLFRADQGRRKS